MKTKVSEVLKSDDTPKEKLTYLWSYYRTHVIVGIFAVLLIGFLVVDWINRPVTYFHLTVLAPEEEILTEEEEELSIQLQEIINPAGANESVYATFTPHGQMAERFVAQITAAEYDVILMDEVGYEEYSQFGTMEEFRIAELEEADHYEPEMHDNPIAIDASQLPVLESYDTTKDMILMIPENSNRKDVTIDFFKAQGYTLEFINE